MSKHLNLPLPKIPNNLSEHTLEFVARATNSKHMPPEATLALVAMHLVPVKSGHQAYADHIWNNAKGIVWL